MSPAQHPPQNRWLAVLGGAVISAAFLGPGTVTTAGRAGAAHGSTLLWALVFATLACWVLQEASARLTIVSGHTLGAALRHRYPHGLPALVTSALVAGAILLGCAAYEAGNILGGVAGAELALPWPRPLLTLLSVLAAAALLWKGETRRVTTVLGALVGVMGVAFVATAMLLGPSLGEVLRGVLVPRVPAGGEWLALGLVGTTVVPYNLFLGSGLARGGQLGETRFGLGVAIGLGGLISMAVVVVGSAVTGEFGFPRLAEVLAGELGPWAATLFALGLFAAGFTSAVTAPLAAALTARGLFARSGEDGADDTRWGPRSLRFRGTWLAILATGAFFGLSGVRPVPAIVVAQALNGILLPVVAIFLFVVMNDRPLLGERVNGPFANLVLGAVVTLATLLGSRGLLAALATASGQPALASTTTLARWGAVAAVLVALGLFRLAWRAR